MTFDEFIIVLDKIKDYTNYLYFHILGEPLLHPDINKFNNDIFDYICKRFACDFNRDNFDFVSLSNRVFLNSFHEFIWPDFNNNFYSDKGKCYGLINHIGILSDGRIVPCCLDSNGDICLGNIFSDSLETILKSDRVNNMISNFKKNRKCETLCCHCNFLETKKED